MTAPGSRLFLAAALVATTTLPAAAQTPDVTAVYGGASNKQMLAFRMKGHGEFVKPIGLMNWEVPASEFGTAGLDRQFAAFCAEPLVGVTAGRVYQFSVHELERPENYGLPNTDEGKAEAVRRAAFSRELFGRYYAEASDANDPEAAAAFQTALWEVIWEGELPAADAKAPFYSLANGTFQANYPNLEQAPPFVQRAERYLTSLNGEDAGFIENYSGRELVRLTGLNTAAGEAVQSQFGLRYASAPAAGGAAGGGPGGGGVFSGIGPLASAPAAGNPAGGGGVGGGFPGIGSSNVPFFAPSLPGGNNPPTGTISTPPSLQPSTSVGTVPTGNTILPGGNTITPGNTVTPVVPPPSNPVPAPAGLVLALVGGGLLAVRRAVGRGAAATA